MNSSNLPSEATLHLRFPAFLALCCAVAVCMTGCGKSGNSADAQSATSGGADAPDAASNHGSSVATVKREPELQPLDHPASPSEAARYIDLSTLPALNGADEAQGRAIANLSYRVAADVKA